MYKPIQLSIAIIAIALFLSGCKDKAASSEKLNTNEGTKSNTTVVTNISSEVISKEARDKMSADNILDELLAGNKRFIAGTLTPHNLQGQVKNAAAGQNPKAIILSCIDSRVPVEEVFDESIGDVFVSRVAGNVVDEDILGSIEYATEHAGAKLVMVLGHESCGAVKAAVDNVKEGNITALVTKIKPSVAENNKVAGEKNSKNAALVDAVCKSNVRNNIAAIRAKSEMLNHLEKEGKIKIVGAYYDLHTGIVSMVE